MWGAPLLSCRYILTARHDCSEPWETDYARVELEPVEYQSALNRAYDVCGARLDGGSHYDRFTPLWCAKTWSSDKYDPTPIIVMSGRGKPKCRESGIQHPPYARAESLKLQGVAWKQSVCGTIFQLGSRVSGNMLTC